MVRLSFLSGDLGALAKIPSRRYNWQTGFVS